MAMCCSEGGCCGGSCKYKGTCIRNLGWALIVLAVIGVILAAIADGVYAGYPFAVVHHISAPIWGGAFIIVAGGLAVCGGKSPENACLRISLLVMSIFAIMFAIVIWIIAAIGLGVDGTQCDWFVEGPCKGDNNWDWNCGWWSDYWYDLYPNWRDIDCGGIKALHALQLLLGLAETVLMFIVSIRTCCGTCRNCCEGTQQPPTHAIVYQPGQPLPQQVHSGVIIMQTAPGGQPYAVQQPAYNPQAQPGSYPMQPQAGPYPTQPQPGSYPTQPQPGSYPTQPQPGTYPAQPQAGAYPGTQPGPYPAQPGSYPTQAGPQPPPYNTVTDQKI
ncbi:protein shisa-4-like isoform X1 [Branchiostoma floridae]|uniref:Protein shisa-4-like isoform X1 n=2 Tax=Branchiostoma floridae TaxID=7739 RepID=A0A9J7LFB7_BRAFL|nr:protein shisa-4-like isoform X1 [Branchiostoma floridae]